MAYTIAHPSSYPVPADQHRRVDYAPVLHRRADAVSEQTNSGEAGDALLRWGLLQTYGAELLERESEREPLRTLPERLAELLITQGADFKGAIVGLQLQTIADYLGAQRETIAAILRVFARQGLVALGRNRIDILDFAGLLELADMEEWAPYSDFGKVRTITSNFGKLTHNN